MDYRLGLDIGTSSVALAAFSLDANQQSQELVYLDEYIFSEPVEPKTLALKNSTRRTKRLMRRQLDRKKARIAKLLHLASLVEVTPAVLKSTSQKYQYTEQVWRLRAEALEKPLTWAELFLVLLRLAKNRGYAGKAPTAKKSVVGNGIKHSQEIIQHYKAQTLGQALWRRYQDDCTKGFRKLSHGEKETDSAGTYVLRDDIKHEFDLIITKQAEFNPQLLVDLVQVIGEEGAAKLLRPESKYFWGYKPNNMAQALEHTIFYQKPLPSFEEKIGKCSLVDTETRVSPAHPLAQRFRLWKTLTDYQWKNGKLFQALSRQQLQILVNVYQNHDEKAFGEIYALMDEKDCPPPQGYKLSHHTVRQSHFKGDSTRAAWRKTKGLLAQWDALSMAQQGQVIEALSDKLSSPEQWVVPEVRERIFQGYGQIVIGFLDLLAKEDGGLPRMADLHLAKGRTAYGMTALQTLNNLMETEGLNEFQAVEKAFGEQQKERTIQATGKLPSVDSLDMTNPVVKRALKETAKAIETCTKRFGAPKSIVIEMMREMRQTLDQRRETSMRQNMQERRRKDAVKELQNQHYAASDSNIRRYLLWKEQDGHCPYSGKILSFNEALDGSATQIEHVLPHSLRGVGNRVDGLVLATTSYNQIKGNETPWGAHLKNPQQWSWDATLRTVRDIEKKNKAFSNKAKLILNQITALDAEEESLDDFADRQYSDTAWIARVVLQWCKHLSSDVTVIRGGLTASLRRQWGFDSVLETIRQAEGKTGGEKGKTLFYKPMYNKKGEVLVFDKRSDHRHHLVDAVAIGLSSRALYKRELQRKIANRDRHSDDVGGRTVKIPCPIPHLREQLIERLTGYVVWKKPDRLVTGRFFDEEPFSPCAEGQTLVKRGEASKRKRSPYDRQVTHIDRHGKEHHKVLVNSEYACMRLTETTLEPVTLLEFNQHYLIDGKVCIPANERLFFKGDTLFYPEKKAFYTIAQLRQTGGLACIYSTETRTYDDLMGTGVTVAIGNVKKLHGVTVFKTKHELGRFIAQLSQQTS
ncbi:MAG: hypothetical protein IPP76_10525 [Moraxellaceae bacterium]|nr:hypothetical protein [Moraxellaceae bacterium]